MPFNKDGTRKDSAFYLRSGNATPFKEMGSSPLKQGNWNPKFGKSMLRGTTAPKTQYGSHKTQYGLKNSLPKDFNIKGDPSKTPKWNPPKVKVNTNLGNWFTKSRDVSGSNMGMSAKAQIGKGIKGMATQGSSRLTNIAQGVTKVVKVGSRVAGGVGVGVLLHDFYKSGQESSGGKYGYKQNPDYTGKGPKHGDAGDNAQFIPTKGKHEDMFQWDPKSTYQKKRNTNSK